jgi:hypothetical protein
MIAYNPAPMQPSIIELNQDRLNSPGLASDQERAPGPSNQKPFSFCRPFLIPQIVKKKRVSEPSQKKKQFGDVGRFGMHEKNTRSTNSKSID